MEKSEERAREAGLFDAAPEPGGAAALVAPAAPAPEYSFQLVADEDPNLALAGLRIEIEKKVKQLVETTAVNESGPGGLSRVPRSRWTIAQSLRFLSENVVLTVQQRDVLLNLVNTLNLAVHGAKVDERSVDWALDIGPRLLATLDRRRPAQ